MSGCRNGRDACAAPCRRFLPQPGWPVGASQAAGRGRSGAGRKRLDSVLDYSAGAYLPFKIGDKIEKDQILGKIYCQDLKSGKEAGSKIIQAYKLSNEVIKGQDLIYDISRYGD